MEKPKTYTILSFIGLVIFLPLGILSLVYSLQTDSFVNDGNYEWAQKSSNKALICNIINYSILIIAILVLVIKLA